MSELRSAASHDGCSHIICSIVGTAEKLVIRAFDTRARTRPGSAFGRTSTLPPLNSVGSVTWPSPTQWNSGAMHSARSVLSTSTWARKLTVFQVMLPWVSTAPLGRPVVPEV